MDLNTLALSALLQRNSRAHGLVKLRPFASSYQELSEKKTSGTQLNRSGKRQEKPSQAEGRGCVKAVHRKIAL